MSKIVAYHISLTNACNSLGEVCLNDLLSFLLAPKLDSIKVFYHLDYSVVCILKLLKLNERECQDLVNNTDLKVKDFNIQYIPKKWFSMRRGNEWCGFSDMAQYNGGSPLKIEQTIDDCMEYAKQASEVGQKVYGALVNIGLHPKSLTSPISVFEKEVLENVDLPTVDDMPADASWYCYQCCPGAWVESFKMGHLKETWQYDQKSAYAKWLSELVDFRLGKWTHTTGFMSKALYGYCRGKLEIESDFSPFMYKLGRYNYAFKGINDEYFITKKGIEFLNRWNIGKFYMYDGWFFVPNVVITDNMKPLRKIVLDLYEKKEKANEFDSTIIKRIMSGGLFGKLLEQRTQNRNGKPTLYNPCWASEVEVNTALANAEFILSNNLQNELLSVVVDSVLVTKPVQLNGSGIGSWKLANNNSALVVSSSISTIKDKKHEGIFAVDYGWLVDKINKSPKSKGYKLTGNSPVTVKKALQFNRFKDMGKVDKLEVTVNIGDELKRDYVKYPKCGDDLLKNVYESKPWDISDIQQIEAMPVGVE